MFRLAAMTIAALPCAVHADLIYVDYWANADWLSQGAIDRGWTVGDPIVGRLTIDTDLAGPDLSPFDNTEGIYGSRSPLTLTADFITGWTGWADEPAELSSDAVHVLNGADTDRYFLTSRHAFGAEDFSVISLQVDLDPDAFSTDGIVQSFDVSVNDDSYQFSYGHVQWGFPGALDYVDSTIEFIVDRLRVTPAVCHR